MQNASPFEILLIHPPLVNPFVPPLAPAVVSGWLPGPEFRCEQVDANLDFFQSWILSSDQLESCFQKIQRPEYEGRLGQADTGIVSLLSEMKKEKQQWQKIIHEADQYQEIAQSEMFFHPGKLGYITNSLKKQMQLFALAYYPCFISYELSQQGENIAGIRKNPETNPFLDHTEKVLIGKLENTNAQMIVVCASEPVQFLAAWTVVHVCKKIRPDIHVACMYGDEIPDLATTICDSIVSGKEPSDLVAQIAALGGPSPQIHDSVPDFHGLPLPQYLLPALVLPFMVTPDREDKRIPPDKMASIIHRQAKAYSAEGFTCRNELLPLSYVHALGNMVSALSPGLFLAVTCQQSSREINAELDFSNQKSIRMITWKISGERDKHVIKDLMHFSKAGLWNHVEVDGHDDVLHLAASNPNIAHSWGDSRASEPRSLFTGERMDVSTPYDKVLPLPGKPLWHYLGDQAQKLLYIQRYGIQKNVRTRIIENDFQAYTLGENLKYFFVKPADLPSGYLDEICNMVEAGGSVGTQWVRYNLERAFLIGYVAEAGVIVGNSSLKHPRPEYIEAVNEQSGLDVSHYLERGYTSVRPDCRGMGIGTKLLEGLTERAGDRKIFSVISEDNDATKKIAIRNRTKQVASFYSKRMGKQLGVWMPEWMIET